MRKSRIKGRQTTYSKSLQNNEYWNDVKRHIRLRDNFHCQQCGSGVRFEVHHISYKVDGKSIVGKELKHLGWLILLCSDCHAAVHKDITHPLHPYNFKKLNAEQFKRFKNVG